VALPAGDRGDLLLTDRAEAVLLLPEVEQPSFPFEFLYHVNVEPFFIVLFPLGVVGICFSSDFHVSFNGCLHGVSQVASDALCFSVKDPIVPVVGREVFLLDPFVGFGWVPASCLSFQFLINGVVYGFEGIPAHHMLMILCPSPNDRV
jgi:hypothetical protein